MKELLLIVFVGIKNKVKISVGEKDASSKEVMWSFSCQFLNSFDMFLSEVGTAEFVNEFIIVDLFVGGVRD